MQPALDHDLPLTTPIPRPARDCYELFCDVTRMPEWVAVLKSAVVEARNVSGRPGTVSFLASFTRATIGYTLLYRYNERELGVTWKNRNEGLHIEGWAQFIPLGNNTTLLSYELTLDCRGVLADWADPFFQGHAASTVMNDFREFATRVL